MSAVVEPTRNWKKVHKHLPSRKTFVWVFFMFIIVTGVRSEENSMFALALRFSDSGPAVRLADASELPDVSTEEPADHVERHVVNLLRLYRKRS